MIRYEETDSWINRHFDVIGGMVIGLFMGLSIGLMFV